MDSLKWLLATGNQGKIRELKRLFEGTQLQLVGLKDIGVEADSPESGDSFLENAKQKAEFYYKQTGLPTFADDSGIEVDHLDGRPGIYSARFGGLPTHAEKCDYLLSLLEDVAPAYRTARFCCAAVFYDGNTFFANQGTIEGFIVLRPRGSGGFGYDPIFAPEWDGPTMAEMDLAYKNTISHRGQAFTGLMEHLKEEGVIPNPISA